MELAENENVCPRHGWVSAAALRRRDISDTAKLIYCTISTYADEHGRCWPSQATIAADLDLRRETVSRAVNELEAAGVVEIIRRPPTRDGQRRTHIYRLTDGVHDGRTANLQAAQDRRPEATVAAPDAAETMCAAMCDTTHTEHLYPEHQNPRSSGAQKHAHGRDGVTSRSAHVTDLPPAIPADWTPAPETVNDAMAMAPEDFDLDLHVRRFAAKCRSKDRYRYDDYDQAWLAWLASDVAERQRKAVKTQSAAETRFAAWSAVATAMSDRAAHPYYA